jgi:hypothetical protein
VFAPCCYAGLIASGLLVHFIGAATAAHTSTSKTLSKLDFCLNTSRLALTQATTALILLVRVVRQLVGHALQRAKMSRPVTYMVFLGQDSKEQVLDQEFHIVDPFDKQMNSHQHGWP